MKYWGALFILTAIGLVGCRSYPLQTESLREAWEKGEVAQAAELASRGAERFQDSRDALLWQLEKGATLRAVGRFEESNRTFDKAAAIIRFYEEEPDIRFSEELTASLTNLSFLPYRGYIYDKIMLAVYETLNFLQLGKGEEARVQLNRLRVSQREAIRQKVRESKQTQIAAANESHFDLQKTEKDPSFQKQYAQAYEKFRYLKPYADYVNPFAVYLDALYFMTTGLSSDFERSRKSFERVLGMIGPNPFIEADLLLLNEMASGVSPSLPSLTYVFFETGLAPKRNEIRIDIPLFLFANPKKIAVPYIGAAFPQLSFSGDYVPFLTIDSAGQRYRTILLADMDRIIASEFKSDLPLVVLRTLIATAAKAAAHYGLRQTTNDALASALLEIAGLVYQLGMNEADLRTWQTLPKQFQFARFPTPKSRRLTLVTTNSEKKEQVDLASGTITVILVKSINTRSPLMVHQFILKQ